MSTSTAVAPPARSRSGPAGLPRLLQGCQPDRAMPLVEHVDHHGPLPGFGRSRRATPLIDLVEAAGLRGRGGAAFPVATKLRAVAGGRRRSVVLVNGSEGETLSAKDRLLLRSLPHLVLDGATLAAEAVGADTIVVGVDRLADDAQWAVSRAVAERARIDPLVATVLTVPPRYVAGEETALVNLVNGGDAKPTFTPPRPFERGVRGRPTLVQNVETLAHLALIARHGADWFRQLGTHDEPGSMLVTVSGAVPRASVCEVALGAPLLDAIDAAGGATCAIGAVLVGGFFGAWLPAETARTLAMTNAALRAAGGALGSGIVYAFPADECGLVATADAARALAAESAGQCGPCVHGLAALADAIGDVAAGRDVAHATARIHRVAEQVRGRGACRYPDGVLRFVESALVAFAPEVHRHAVDHGCRLAAPTPLPVQHSSGGWR